MAASLPESCRSFAVRFVPGQNARATWCAGPTVRPTLRCRLYAQTNDVASNVAPIWGGDLMTNDVDQASTAAAPATGRRPALTREQILTAAVAIIDAEGVEALTMRRLGQALGRDPMAIYRHAADKDALLDGIVEHVAAELITPREPDSNGDGNWEAELRRTAHTFRRVALAHPHVVPLLLTRPLAGPLALRPLGSLQLLEELIELFSVAGFDP